MNQRIDSRKNNLKAEDHAIHSWYRFVLAYPPHLVREYLEKFEADPERDWIYDPFSGTATTPLEARLNGFSTIGSDSNPIALLANRVKLNWDIDIEDVVVQLEAVVQMAADAMRTIEISPKIQHEYQLALFEAFQSPRDLQLLTHDSNQRHVDFDVSKLLNQDAHKLLPSRFISPLPLKRVLAIRYAIEECVSSAPIREFFLLALANTIVSTAGNVAFGPEIYATRPKDDAPVLSTFYETVHQMIGDLREVISERTLAPDAYHVVGDDARKLESLSSLPQVGVVITSPPYPNEKRLYPNNKIGKCSFGLPPIT